MPWEITWLQFQLTFSVSVVTVSYENDREDPGRLGDAGRLDFSAY